MISIIVPCFNVEKYIERCFDSIKNQTYRNFEIVFINDGSTDATLSILKEIINNYPNLNIVVYSQDNQGVSVARNTGLELANGEYVTFIDADDFVFTDFLQVLNDNKDGVGLSVVGITGDGFNIKKTSFEGIIPKDKFVYEFWLTQHLWGSVANKIYSMQIIQDHNLSFDPELKIMEDMYFNMNYCQHIDKIYVSNQQLYYYPKNAESTMHNSNFSNKMTIIATFHKLLNLPLSKSDHEIIELHQVNSLIWVLNNLYKNKELEDFDQFKETISKEFKKSNRLLFLKKGWKKGSVRYLTFLVYQISPTLYENLMLLYCKFK